MTIYLSGAISTDSDYIEKFAKYKANLIKHRPTDTIICPVTDVNHADHGKRWVDYMRARLRALLQCEAIALMPDWEGATESRIERMLAVNLHMEIIVLGQLGEGDYSC